MVPSEGFLMGKGVIKERDEAFTVVEQIQVIQGANINWPIHFSNVL